MMTGLIFTRTDSSVHGGQFKVSERLQKGRRADFGKKRVFHCCCEGEGTCKWCKIEGPSGYAIVGEPKIALDYNGERDMIKRKPIEHSIVAYYGKMKKRKLGLQF